MGKKNQTEKDLDNSPIKEGRFINSMRFRIWLNFMIVCCLIIGAVWVIEMIFFPYQYGVYRKNQIQEAGEYMSEVIIDGMENGATVSEVRNSAREISNYYEGTVHLFYAEFEQDVDGNIVEKAYTGIILEQYYLSSDAGVEVSEDIRLAFYLNALQADEFTYINADNMSIVYGAKLIFTLDNMSNYEGDYYLLLSSTTELGALTESTVQNIFLFATSICLIITIVLAWVVSSHISSPIKQFSSGVKKIAKGDYSVTFGGNGMEEIDNLAENLNYVTDEIKKTETLRREFLANVSHDLRTPLTMVKAYAEMIRDISGNNNKKREEHSQIIINEADRLTALVNEISELAKLDSGVAELKMNETDLSMVARTVIERFKVYQTRDGYSFITNIEPDCIVYADMARIEQVFYNLISNAINYTGEDKCVKLDVYKKDGKIRVDVGDTGKGISKEDIAKIWERYYRASQKKRQVVGSGLGLSIVKNILITHKANYGIDSKVGEGSTFWFELEEFTKS